MTAVGVVSVDSTETTSDIVTTTDVDVSVVVVVEVNDVVVVRHAFLA